MKDSSKIVSSFRDPSGFLFIRNGKLYRQINPGYKQDYDLLMSSGLYEILVGENLLVSHEEIECPGENPKECYKVIAPEPIAFISYPYEWCFSQMKEAALATLKIQKMAIQAGMCLKDSSAFNIQFSNGCPVLIDTLSFEKYREGKPWVAYRQFCQHFLLPLMLMVHCDVRFHRLSQIHLDGIPLDFGSRLLPFWTYFLPSYLAHVHLHALSQRFYGKKFVAASKVESGAFSKSAMLGLIDSLEKIVLGLRWKPSGTEWAEYYGTADCNAEGLEKKKAFVRGYLKEKKPGIVWDLGANTGVFSRLASDVSNQVISFDVDPAAVEKNYALCRKEGKKNVLPLVLDLCNPTPSIGWELRERASFFERPPADLLLALALVHHLAISNNLPLDYLAKLFSRLGKFLVIEFVPKEDIQVERMLSVREDIFPQYNEAGFEQAFSQYFHIENRVKLEPTGRTLYFMKVR
ncbi:MAG: SAM-dependent methyltransferase [Candidatus Omnitrophica bacterium]|nr:SAM-dependent methyltransferase [Candidatus Omnitrophota bacterium]